MIRRDLKSTAGIMAMVKNPNFPPPKGNIMESSTTSVDIKPKNLIGDTSISNVADKPAPGADKPLIGKKSGPQTWNPSQMAKDLKKGFRLLVGYSDKVLPPKKS